MTVTVNVPNVPGVPSVAFSASFSIGDDQVLTADLIGGFASPTEQWGIFQNGSAVVTADSVVGLDYKQEWAISDYPVEKGAFESYDKVALPFDSRVRFTAGSAAARASLLASISAIAGTTQVFDVVTPDAVYPSVNITHYDYRRTARSGLGLLSVDIWCLQINQTASLSASGTSTQGTATPDGTAQPSGADPVNGGSVQPTATTATQSGIVLGSQELNANDVSAAGGIP